LYLSSLFGPNDCVIIAKFFNSIFSPWLFTKDKERTSSIFLRLYLSNIILTSKSSSPSEYCRLVLPANARLRVLPTCCTLSPNCSIFSRSSLICSSGLLLAIDNFTSLVPGISFITFMILSPTSKSIFTSGPRNNTCIGASSAFPIIEEGVALTFNPGISWTSFFIIAANLSTEIDLWSFGTRFTVISLLFFSLLPVPISAVEYPMFEKTLTTSGFWSKRFSTFCVSWVVW